MHDNDDVPLERQPRRLRRPHPRVRPGDPEWPDDSRWRELDQRLGGRLVPASSPLDDCDPRDVVSCEEVFAQFKNPYFIRDHSALTQTTGWLDAWVSAPSAFVVDVRDAADVATAVDFARRHHIRIVVRGGGHSYLGTSNAADSLLVRTQELTDITLHEGFVPQGSDAAPRPAVSVGAGTLWLPLYAAVTQAGRYVQGGGCCTVNVAGLLSGGGFGSFSKRFGVASSSLLEAEIVTADGRVRTVNGAHEPELFWALKGGGATFGVVTRVTLATHELPSSLGALFGAVQAHSDEAFRRLVREFLRFYRDALLNPVWGEQVTVHHDARLEIALVFQGIDKVAADAIWQPFVDWLRAAPRDFSFIEEIRSVAAPARCFWDVAFLRANLPGLLRHDDRPGAPDDAAYWAANVGEAGWYIENYESLWLPQTLLDDDVREHLTDALLAAAGRWSVGLHFNKGLAGAPAEAITAATGTPVHPAAREAFALAIVASGGPPARPGFAGHEPDVAGGRARAASVSASLAELAKLVPGTPAYPLEASYFQRDWQQSFWGSENYERLRAVKERYDPDGVFFLHHGPGSEDWSPDGFTPRPRGDVSRET